MRKDEMEEYKQCNFNTDIEREEECGICVELNSKIVLPNCSHSMYLQCNCQWYLFHLNLSLSLSSSLFLAAFAGENGKVLAYKLLHVCS